MMKKLTFETNAKRFNQELDELCYQFSARKSMTDSISCISYISDNMIICGDDQGQLHIFQTSTLGKINCLKIFDHTLDKIHGPFDNGFFFLQSQFSQYLKLVQIKISSHSNLSNNSNDSTCNQEVQVEIKENIKFHEAIQFMQKISDMEFAISYKCGQLKFFLFNNENSQEIITKKTNENNKWVSRINEEYSTCINEYTSKNQQQINKFSKDEQYFIETSQFNFKNPVTHLAKVNSELTVCRTERELIILYNKQVHCLCKYTLEHLSYIIPFNKDSFFLGNQRGEMQLVCYNKSKKSLQQIMIYNLPNTNIVTSLNKYGNRSIIYTSEKGAFIHDLMSRQTVCLHHQFSISTAIQPGFNSESKTIVIADKLSSLHILSQMKEMKVSA